MEPVSCSCKVAYHCIGHRIVHREVECRQSQSDHDIKNPNGAVYLVHLLLLFMNDDIAVFQCLDELLLTRFHQALLVIDLVLCHPTHFLLVEEFRNSQACLKVLDAEVPLSKFHYQSGGNIS